MPRKAQSAPYWGPTEKQLLYRAIGIAHRDFTSIPEATNVILHYIDHANGGLKPTDAELQSELKKMICECRANSKRNLFINWPQYERRYISSPDTEGPTSSDASVHDRLNPRLNVSWDEQHGDGIETDDEQQQEDEAECREQAVETDETPYATQQTTQEDIGLTQFTAKLLQAVKGKGPESLRSIDPEDDIKPAIDRSLRKIGEAFTALPQILIVAMLSFSNATSDAARLSQVLFEQDDWERGLIDEMNALLAAHGDSVYAVLQAFAAAAAYLWVFMDIDGYFKFDPDESIADREAFDALHQAQPTVFEKLQGRYPDINVYLLGEEKGIFNILRREHPNLFEDFDIIREVYHLNNKIKRELPTYADRLQQRLLDAIRSLCQSKDKRLWRANEQMANETSSASRLEALQKQWRQPVTEAFLEVLKLKLAMRQARLLYHFTFPTVRSKFERESMESAHSRDVVAPKDGRVDLCLRPSVWFKRRQSQKDGFKVMIPARVLIEGVAEEFELN